MSDIKKRELAFRQRTAANAFAEAAEFLRTVTAAQDYYTGYTTIEAINERIAEIGEDPESSTATYSGRLTRLAALKNFELQVLAAIEATKQLGAYSVQQYDTGVAALEENPSEVK